MGSLLARDVWLEIDLTGSDLLVSGTSNFDHVLEPINPIEPGNIRVMRLDEVLQKAKESEWIPYQDMEDEYVFEEEFSVFLSLPILREIGWAGYSIDGIERVPDRIAQLTIDEVMIGANSNLNFWLDLSSMILREKISALGVPSAPTPLPLVKIE